MILRLSQDKGRASAIGSRYFTTEAEWEVVDSSAFAFKVEPVEELEEEEKPKGKKGSLHKVVGYTLQSPEVSLVPGARGCLLISSHPSLGGELKLITPDANPRQGFLTVKTKHLDPQLPYHFRISILPHGHLS